MGACIGCKCCVVACNEQNGNPAALNWRRVGELEGGQYPFAQRFHLSMACNHCLEPSCLAGCPVRAYTKDARTGIVLHDADACIGCQYCTWNCSYGVPQYNAERGVVGKCDLCYHRLADAMAPACVAACPEGAIAVELVNAAAWRRDYTAAEAPGLPSASDSLSTTRISLPDRLTTVLERVDSGRVAPEPPHWPLIVMLVLTQLAVGACAVLWTLEIQGAQGLPLAACAAAAIAAAGLAASTLHLGRPAYAFRALKGLRRSWLSREVLTLTLFAAAAACYAGLSWSSSAARSVAAAVALLAGVTGVTSSARIYVLPARPAWNSPFTPAEFFATALLLGPLLVLATVRAPAWVRAAALAGGLAQLSLIRGKYGWLSRAAAFELRATAELLRTRLRGHLAARLALLVATLACTVAGLNAAALALGIVGEGLGRYLFFVSVVPKNMASAFLQPSREAA
jgi:Fe-S-cluster-containing dehydrogenase component/DMSO reductase anchor subunit